MLVLKKQLLNRPVMSLRTGGRIATARTPIINPKNLKIEGFYCDDKVSKKQTVLLERDIRDLIKQGYVVNDREVLSDPDELIRLKKLLDMSFYLSEMPVETVSKERVGKVTDWAAESTTFYIQKIYVSQSVLKSFNQNQLSVDRNQIVEITKKKIIIQDLLKPEKGAVPAAAPMT